LVGSRCNPATSGHWYRYSGLSPILQYREFRRRAAPCCLVLGLARGHRRRLPPSGLQEFYQVTFRKKIYETIEQLQIDLDQWIDYYNNERTHQGKVCEGRTPMQTLLDGKRIWKEKFVG
jgi:hypothetical protein